MASEVATNAGVRSADARSREVRWWLAGTAALATAALALWLFAPFGVQRSAALVPAVGGKAETVDAAVPLLAENAPSNQVERPSESVNADAASDPDLASRELQWMSEHGYPSTDQWSTLARLDVLDLERQAAQGSIAATTVLGYKLGLHGCDELVRDLGERLLLEATSHGSSFAPQLLAEVRVAHRPDEWFAALGAGTALMHAYLLGDHAASGALQDAVPGGMISQVTGIALMEWQEMQDARLESGLPPLVNHPRPRGGIESAYEFDAAAPLDGRCYESAAFD